MLLKGVLKKVITDLVTETTEGVTDLVTDTVESVRQKSIPVLDAAKTDANEAIDVGVAAILQGAMNVSDKIDAIKETLKVDGVAGPVTQEAFFAVQNALVDEGALGEATGRLDPATANALAASLPDHEVIIEVDEASAEQVRSALAAKPIPGIDIIDT